MAESPEEEKHPISIDSKDDFFCFLLELVTAYITSRTHKQPILPDFVPNKSKFYPLVEKLVPAIRLQANSDSENLERFYDTLQVFLPTFPTSRLGLFLCGFFGIDRDKGASQEVHLTGAMLLTLLTFCCDLCERILADVSSLDPSTEQPWPYSTKVHLIRSVLHNVSGKQSSVGFPNWIHQHGGLEALAEVCRKIEDKSPDKKSFSFLPDIGFGGAMLAIGAISLTGLLLKK